mmetsp:Transcript_26657/g.75274  ORF Transcript_26657/g.75274 Transcript_26657/m.75274 type:complete len:216 (-) Transcript_26657:146-793(-)
MATGQHQGLWPIHRHRTCSWPGISFQLRRCHPRHAFPVGPGAVPRPGRPLRGARRGVVRKRGDGTEDHQPDHHHPWPARRADLVPPRGDAVRAHPVAEAAGLAPGDGAQHEPAHQPPVLRPPDVSVLRAARLHLPGHARARLGLRQAALALLHERLCRCHGGGRAWRPRGCAETAVPQRTAAHCAAAEPAVTVPSGHGHRGQVHVPPRGGAGRGA